jgi:hypothetical protein
VPATSIALRINANGTGSVEKERTERRRRMRARNLREDERDSGLGGTLVLERHWHVFHVAHRSGNQAHFYTRQSARKVLTLCA